ncbi:high affinity sulphate transporter 1 [Jatrophihabitans sp. GAS493]|nr:high affinity sulphate transporter 1 [Jatrophihabitans sp. GAS493]
MLSRYVPIFSWIRSYQGSFLRGDLIGALTAWAIVVPESVAYAQIAGVPPQNAFYAAPIALLAYALFGSSRNLVVGATSAAAILSASTVAAVSSDAKVQIQLSAALAIVAGVILLVAGLLKMGFITNFLAESALQGFLFGMAMIIVIRQLGKVVGISTGDGDFFERLWHLLSHIDEWSVATIVVGVAAIVALLLLERFLPKIPASLAVLAAGIACSYIFSLAKHGVEVVGKIPSSVPTLTVPDVSATQYGELLGGSFGLALIVFAESYSISSRFAQAHNTEVNADQEMIAMGASNAAAGIFGGFAVSGSASRTAAAEGAGGLTQMLSIMAAIMVLITGAFLTPLFTQLPEPILGAIVIVAVRGFLRVDLLRRYWQRDRVSFAVALSALLGVLFFDLLPGLIIAVGLSLILFIGRASDPELAILQRDGRGDFLDSADNPDTTGIAGTLIVRPNGGLFFGNVDRVRKEILALVDGSLDPGARPVTQLYLVLTASFRLSLPVLDSLGALHSQLQRSGCQLWLVGVPSSARAELQADDLYAAVGPDHVVHLIGDAVAAGAAGGDGAPPAAES